MIYPFYLPLSGKIFLYILTEYFPKPLRILKNPKLFPRISPFLGSVTDFSEKSSPHFSQISGLHHFFYVYTMKSCKNNNFWIDFVTSLTYNRKATEKIKIRRGEGYAEHRIGGT
jgi:hypothetical protein